jgi:hypothetical protein
MNIQEIHQQLVILTQLERKTLAEILELLRLNFKRKVFAKMGYSHLTIYSGTGNLNQHRSIWSRNLDIVNQPLGDDGAL